jgi:hypothetical protein
MSELYCPLSSAICSATIPTLPLFEMDDSPVADSVAKQFLVHPLY